MPLDNIYLFNLSLYTALLSNCFLNKFFPYFKKLCIYYLTKYLAYAFTCQSFMHNGHDIL